MASLETMPERFVKTRSLAVGNLFAAGGVLYQVIDPVGGYFCAKLWGGDQTQVVALDPTSPLAAHHPVVTEGEPVPGYLKKVDLLNEQGMPARFRFPTQSMAFKAVHLDQALMQPVGVAARVYGPMAYVLADEVGNYRYYYYYFKDQYKHSSGLTGTLAQSGVFGSNYNYDDGPAHWRFVL